MHKLADLTARALAKEAERDWQACMGAPPAIYYDQDERDTVEARMVCRPATAREMHAFALHRSAQRLVAVFTATYSFAGGAYVAERHLVRLPLGARLPVSTGEALWRAGYTPESDYVELTEETIGALCARASQGGAS